MSQHREESTEEVSRRSVLKSLSAAGLLGISVGSIQGAQLPTGQLPAQDTDQPPTARGNGLDPFTDSSEAVTAWREGAYEPLIIHNVADIRRTRALMELAERYCSKSDFSMKSLEPITRRNRFSVGIRGRKHSD